MDTVAERAAFYRANPQRFAAEYLGLSLKRFQQIVLFMMNLSTNFMYLAARGQGKSYLIAVFCVVRCILYPGTVICIASKTRKQAEEILEKIQNDLIPKAKTPYLRQEIKEIVIGQRDSYAEFHNTSRIFVATANENSRHFRANMLICDEFRMVDLSIIDTVLRNFLTAPRYPKYLDKPEYAHLIEENREIYASSCWFESHWSFEKAMSYFVNMLNEDVESATSFGICALPYQISIKEGLLSKSRIIAMMKEATYSEMSFYMEMECLWWSDADGGLYSHEDIARTRKIKYPYYPPSIVPSLSDKRIRIPRKVAREYRILSVDIALMGSSGGHDNDAASLFVNFMMPATGSRYISNYVYTENIEDVRADDLAVLIRRRFEEFQCDYLAIDARGLGLPILDLLMKDLVDPMTGEIYGPLSCCNNPDIAARCVSRTAPKAIWAMMGSAQFNSECALSLREAFRQGVIKLPITYYECEDILMLLPNYNKFSPAEINDLKIPYMHTDLLENELIGLTYETKNNVVKVQERHGARKDRYSSLSYNNYVAKE
ncbi:MAG: hypothetical protein J6C81_00395, partial [Muribaculaceae bacterium]|nr:hypothetical protein [Muribaculaceae bacterium]